MRDGWWILPGAFVGLCGWALFFWGLWAVFLAPTADTDRGGSVLAYSARAEAHTGPLPLDCQSACTLYLLRGCVTPAHRLTFHLPSVDIPYWRLFMAAHYPPHVAMWFVELPAGAWVWPMAGSDAIRLGARECVTGP